MVEECTEVQEWFEEEIWKPVETWVEEQMCQQYPWYDPRAWGCWIVTTLVRVVVWVIVKVGKWVVRTVCKFVSAWIQTLFDVLGGLAEIFMGIINGILYGDFSLSLHGLIKAVLGIVNLFFTLVRIVFLGDTVDFIHGEVDRDNLRKIVRTLLEAKYSGDELQKIKDKLHLDRGYFGYRIPLRIISTYLDSETPSPDEPGVPNLVKLHEDGKINLRELCSFQFPALWNRKRYTTVKKNVSRQGSRTRFSRPVSVKLSITRQELEKYLSSRGSEGPKFIVFCMEKKVLETKMRTAELKAREIGLIPQWEQENLEVKLPEHIIHDGKSSSHARFLTDIVGRSSRKDKAFDELCKPVAVGVFGFNLETQMRGIAACLAGSPCLGGPDVTSGVAFADCLPDIVWKYVLIHELGHYFGLCHVDGVDRIMYARKKMISWWTLPNLVYFKGEPSFTLDEAKQVWEYIVEHFPSHCLRD